jgi:poly(3-hydroxybutyrate) depolymerase
MKNYLLMAAMLLGMAASAQQTAKGLTASNNVFIGFLEYKPVDYNTNTNKYPLIIFLHGIGERGNGTTELSKVAGNAIPRYINDGEKMSFTWNGKTETFLVLSPQLSSNYGWWQPFYVEEMINYAKQNLRIDTNRIILTGLSLGGGGVWSYAAGSLSNAKKLAAISSVCGTCQNVSWCNIANANLPTWGFHAQDDGTVPSSCTSGAVTAINNCSGSVKAYSTIWSAGQHWIWDRAYDRTLTQQNPNVFEWFLAQNKSLAPNKRPVANAGADIATTTGAGSATLSAAGSSDADGSIVRYVWRLVSGPTQVSFPAAHSTTATTTVSGMTIAGTYQLELKTVDDRADWSTDLVTITVTSGGSSTPPPPSPTTNKPVVVKAGADFAVTLPVNNITLDGTGTTDPDGPVHAYEWTKMSGPAATITDYKAARTTVTGLVAGTYSFRLSAWGDNWVPMADTVIVTVNAAPVTTNKAPVAIAGSDITNTLPANGATLNGAASYDTDGNIAAYAWSKIAGPAQGTLINANTASAMAASLAEGTHTYRLQVTDDKGAVSADTMQVIVKSAPVTGNQPVVANAGTDEAIILPVNRAILDGSASYDVDGPVLAYEWKKISGPTQCVFADQRSAVAIASNLVAGTYKFELMVWGDNWVPRADTVTIRVKTSVNDTVTVPVTPPVNSPVVCKAGDDMMIILPASSVEVDGSASYDVDGPVLAYEWKKISGPSSYAIANSRNAKTTISNLQAGTYKFELMVWGDNWVPRADTVQVTVGQAATSMMNNTMSGRISEMMIEPQVKVYPSPATNTINMQYQDGNKGQATAIIYDMSGKIVSTMNFTKDNTVYQKSMDVAKLTPGVYHMAVISNNKRILTSFVKQ